MCDVAKLPEHLIDEPPKKRRKLRDANFEEEDEVRHELADSAFPDWNAEFGMDMETGMGDPG